MSRAEVTGRKPGVSAERPPQVSVAPMPQLAMSIAQFAVAHGFSPSMYFKMKKQGQALPREMKVGSRTLITFESAAKWRAEREAASNAKPAAGSAKGRAAATKATKVTKATKASTGEGAS